MSFQLTNFTRIFQNCDGRCLQRTSQCASTDVPSLPCLVLVLASICFPSVCEANIFHRPFPLLLSTLDPEDIPIWSTLYSLGRGDARPLSALAVYWALRWSLRWALVVRHIRRSPFSSLSWNSLRSRGQKHRQSIFRKQGASCGPRPPLSQNGLWTTHWQLRSTFVGHRPQWIAQTLQLRRMA